jgi:hypothetical protein
LADEVGVFAYPTQADAGGDQLLVERTSVHKGACREGRELLRKKVCCPMQPFLQNLVVVVAQGVAADIPDSGVSGWRPYFAVGESHNHRRPVTGEGVLRVSPDLGMALEVGHGALVAGC